ncbi:MAG: B12-binding domain-containing radical SAM protein [Gemmatimonadota bacterium]|nr:MAG: B12-binding domain-containing radical SAM protein [Gemmatimonadota bacterium]
MLVTLVHPPQLISPTNYISTIAIPPLGLAYLASSAQAAGYQVKAVDAIGTALDQIWEFEDGHGFWLRGLRFDEILDAIDPASDVIGVGCMFSCSWPSTRELLRQMRARFPNALLVLGGEHASAEPITVLNEVPIDLCVSGEGEETLVDVLNRHARGESYADCAGVSWRGPEGPVTNEARQRIRDLDEIPLPDWDLFPVETYIEFASPHGAVRGRSMPMLATRGCPYQCTFCSSPQMWTTAWRARDKKLVVDEMVGLHEKYGATDFHFEDLTAVVKRTWIVEFCEEVLSRDVEFTWQLPSGTRSEAIDEEVAQLMVKAGCRNFSYSIESGSVETLKIIKKRIHLPKVHTSAKAALRAGIRLQVNFILGFPHETWRHARDTYREIARCAWTGFHEFNCCAFSPLPNTEAFAELEAQGRVKPDDAYYYSLFGYMDITDYKSWHPRWSHLRLRTMIYGAYGVFYGLNYLFRPWRLFAEIYQYSTRSSQGKLGKLIRGLIRNRKLQWNARRSVSTP